uniref:ribosomal protein S7 n=1 Tax=Euplotes vannus TaxID=5939 RepID=UPI002E77EA0C|nr:ribosomal protein S7 [Euplotes vannus]UPM52118.1 ribosomal protein S7 [Euplotes vannus]
MHFTFIPTFLHFFRRFNYLPSQIRYKYLTFTDKTLLRSILSLFYKRGDSHTATFLTLTVVHYLWCFLLNNLNTNPYTKITTFMEYVAYTSKLVLVFTRLRFVFFFFFYKLNKLIYKYSNYKRPRYSLEFRYVPPYRRFKELLKYMRKSLVYYKGRTFRTKFQKLIIDLLLTPQQLQFVQFTEALQSYLFSTRKRLLYYR